MRKILVVLSVTLVAVVLWSVVPRAQFGFGRRRLSPHETTNGIVDTAKLSITYGRPSMRGRQIFGSLVSYDSIWCPGADECTMLTTDHALQFRDLTLPAGEYSMWMLPTATVWTLFFNRDAHAFHTRHNPRGDVGQVRLDKEKLAAPVEQLTFTIEKNPSAAGGRIVMDWETTRVVAPFVVAR